MDDGASKIYYYNLTGEFLRGIPDKDIQQIKAEKEEARRCARLQVMAENYEMRPVPVARLNNGVEIPLVGLGTWKSEKGKVRDAVECAIRCGYRHIDCAQIYGNEKEVGEALETIFKEGVVKRNEVFITSKLWNDYHGSDDVKPALLRTLKDLKLEYLDLFLVHWPVTGKHGSKLDPSIQETWQAMEKLVDEGLTRTIGVSNFSPAKLKDMLLYCKIVPAVNQIERHPNFRNSKTVQWCKTNSIHVSAYSPLGSPDSQSIFEREQNVNLLANPLVEKIATQLNKTPGQVLIRWAIEDGTSVLPKSVTPSRIKSNLEVADWELPAEDYKAISSFKSQLRMVDGNRFLSPDGPFQRLSDLWDDPEEDGYLEEYIKSMYKGDIRAPLVSLGKDIEMPLLGLGTWRSGPGEIKESVITSIHAGYRHIDCAAIYENEAEVGEALQQIFSEGILQRKDLWITSKLWNSCHSKESVLPAVQKTLKSLGLDYLDLYLIHWPITGNVGPVLQPSLEETWVEMEALVDAGLVRSIGVSNFSSKKLESILQFARIKPAVNQVECHPYFRNDALLAYCKENGIHMTAYSPLGGAPENESLVKRKLPRLLQDPDVNAIAEKRGKGTAQILIRWAVQHGTSVLPKSSKPKRIEENLDVFSWSLDDNDYETLSNLSTQMRMLDGNFFLNPRGPYKTVEDLWDE